MGVTIAITGFVRSARDREIVLRWIEGRAADLEWNRRPVALTFKKARLRAGPATTWLEMPRAAGMSFLPHFACEELPLVFLEEDGRLVDEVVEQYGTDAPTFLDGGLVKTQFAGPAVHREVCEVLKELRGRAPEIAIDDETGFAASGDEQALARAFADGWAGIRSTLAADRPRPGTRIDVGGFPIEVRDAPIEGEFGAVSPEQRGWILEGERAFVGRFSGFGTSLDRSRESVTDLELAISDVDVPEFAKDPGSPAVQDLAFSAGAYFGRALVATLGGGWVDEGGELAVADVGGSGLIVDPFQVARDRILGGPPHGFPNHLDVYETLARELARDRMSG